jgi:glutamate-ammonia-ligase adenylyltransferase
MSASREVSTRGRLARLGFTETQASADLVDAHPLIDSHLEIIRACADPDAAVQMFARLISGGGVDAASWSDDQWRVLSHLFGTSAALGDHLARFPHHVSYVSTVESVQDANTLRETLVSCVKGHDWEQALINLRIAYRREVSAIAALDASALEESVRILPGIAQALTDLADAVLAGALVAAKQKVAGSENHKLAIIAMGKCGARELNFVSDVDVIFVAEPADDISTELAKAVMQACSAVTPEGVIWEVDPGLRPEGKAGALVRTLASHIDYYERWAQNWEYQALLKARYMAGDENLGQAFVAALAPFVWKAAGQPGFIEGVQAMRERVTDLIPAKEAERELKLGRGGLRDVEFAVQLLQMVHGRSDEMIRSSNTLVALEQLANWGYIGRDDNVTLSHAYRFLRTLEHRIQMFRMRRTHVLPTDENELRRLGKSMGFSADPVEELTKEWKKHAREVRRIHEKLFYRPLLEAVARLNSEDARLTPEAARQRLAALGYVDPDGALRHLEALTSGVSRKAVIQRTLLPVMLEWFANTPDPDSGLLGFRKVSEALGSTPWYLRLLRDESVTAERLAKILGTSSYATELLLRSPEAVSLLATEESLVPRSADELASEVMAIVARYTDASEAVVAIRGVRRRELFRTSTAAVLGLLDIETVGDSLTVITDITLQGALAAVTSHRKFETPFLIIAMGRYGGAELGFGSDADVMFCYDESSNEAFSNAQAIASELRALLMAPSPDPELLIDADLRPEGKNGPIVRSLESFAAYYERWSAGWETQALLRAAFSAGNEALSERFFSIVDEIRYSKAGLSSAALFEIRKLKSRMESERMPRGIDPNLHIKLGPGGLSDVEWVAQIIQMEHAFSHPQLRTTKTLQVLRDASELGIISSSDAQTLINSWKLASQVRDAIVLVKGRPSDVVPKDIQDLNRVAQVLNYGPSSGQQLLDDYRRATRRARQVTVRLLYGQTD